ncbi:MAG: polyphosphate kinase 1 [Sphingobacteriaceae bacterium]|nr:polyphosphate kinase 1 [Sphingobacteriaceae bacterium]
MHLKKIPLLNREISWLYFNDRVLQEAADKSVPLLERLRFLAIFSSNLDEFYRVRIAILNRLALTNNKFNDVLGYNPKKLLNQIRSIVVTQEKKFNNLFEKHLVKELANNKIFILNEHQLNVSRGEFVRNYFNEQVLSTLVPIILTDDLPFPELKDRYEYFFIKLTKKSQKSRVKYALIELPKNLKRFLVLPQTNQLQFVILVDDIIRYCLKDIFYTLDYDTIEAYTVQLTRDAELDLSHDVSDKFLDVLTKSLQKRRYGKPMRLLYDREMPSEMRAFLVSKLHLSNDSLIPGNRYHNFKDFINFPNVGNPALEYEKQLPLKISELDLGTSILNQIAEKDYLVNLPYQSFDYIIHFLREAAIDPKVKEIKITLYRLAENSSIINALINAAKNGKKVHCFLELKARFDEEANIYWTDKLKEGGVHVDFGIWDFKVHSKICLVTRLEKRKKVHYANLSTGNFNEKTAKLYCDHSLFTANPQITNEVQRVFTGLLKKTFYKDYKQLIVSPLESRKKLFQLIDSEIAHAKKGKNAYIILKMNSLTDPKIIEKLYEASQTGVKIELIIRGMCSLLPGVEGFSENINIISIIDRYLEHARVWIFGNKGDEKIYLSSADLMTRNLDHRLEVGFPILDPLIQLQIRDIIDLQLRDNIKARIIQSNGLSPRKKSKKTNIFRAQTDTYNYLKTL